MRHAGRGQGRARGPRRVHRAREDRLRLQAHRALHRRGQACRLRPARARGRRSPQDARHRGPCRPARRAARRARHRLLPRRHGAHGHRRPASGQAPSRHAARWPRRPVRSSTARPRCMASRRCKAASRSRRRAARSRPTTSSSAPTATPMAPTRWLRRRLVPVRSRIIATEPLSDNLMSELMPKGVMCSETRKLHYYYRPSPDGRASCSAAATARIAGEPTWPTDSLQPRAGRHLSRARRRRHHPQLVRLRRHEPRHDPAHLLARRHALRGRLLRLGRGMGALGRPEGRMAGARRRAWPLSARLPPAADDPALQRQALVPAGSLCLDDAAGSAGSQAPPISVGRVKRSADPTQAAIAFGVGSSPTPIPCQCLVSPTGIWLTGSVSPGTRTASAPAGLCGAGSRIFCSKRR